MNKAWAFERFSVHLAFSTPAETAELSALFSPHCQPITLEAFTLDASSRTGLLSSDLVAMSVVPFDALRPLLAFRGLREGEIPSTEASGLRFLDVDDAVLTDPEPVATHLSALFPDLEETEPARHDEVGEDVQERATRLHGLWKEVARLRGCN
ncbi:hypothetical protein B0H13DRAFT_1893336 [Mycena leptocephala]|nr:hypothetical protein B0H13DRAFT_1893336 [Mycena leptocephala]